VTSQFGLRLHPIFGDWRLHTGTDFGAPCGTPTISTRSGTVTFTGVVSGYGNRVVVDHGIVAGKRLETAYNHLSVIAVQAGQALVAGQPIGRVGTTGNSTGCHLHFEVRVDGAYTDAMPYLNGRPSTAVVTVPDVKATPTPTPTASTRPPTPTPTASATPQSTPTPTTTATTTPEPTPTATTTPEPGDGDATTNGSASTTSTTDPAAAGSTNATD
jgi:murein DD-endopeptidase MepM/ murein hydrolase activator NlpD